MTHGSKYRFDRTRVPFEISADNGVTWMAFGVSHGYEAAAAEFIATCGGLDDEIVETLADGNTVEGTSIRTGRLVRARAEKAD